MSRNIDPKCRLCRRAGEKLFLKGEKCFTPKCPMVRRPYPPGQHGQGRPSRPSVYALQLREKQKARHIYGLTEAQFSGTFEKALRRTGDTGGTLLELLERRLDNVVYRLGIARSRAFARQLVTHGHFLVNGTAVNIPSYQMGVGDTVSIKGTRQGKALFQLVKKELAGVQPPGWLELNREEPGGRVVDVPSRTNTASTLNLQLIVEYYSR